MLLLDDRTYVHLFIFKSTITVAAQWRILTSLPKTAYAISRSKATSNSMSVLEKLFGSITKISSEHTACTKIKYVAYF